jgi:hypothetical protein
VALVWEDMMVLMTPAELRGETVDIGHSPFLSLHRLMRRAVGFSFWRRGNTQAPLLSWFAGVVKIAALSTSLIDHYFDHRP